MNPYTLPGINYQINVNMIPHILNVDFTLRNRQRENVIPRQIAMALMYVFSTKSLKDVGKVFGKDHATVVHCIKVMDNCVSSYDSLVYPILEPLFNRLYFEHLKRIKFYTASLGSNNTNVKMINDKLRLHSFTNELIERYLSGVKKNKSVVKF